METGMGGRKKVQAEASKPSPVKALMEELTVTVDDAAMLLRLSRHGTYAAIREGQIPSIRIGRVIRVPSAALRAMLQIETAPEKATAAAAE
jgi:excisionase family DNA binding protein